MKAPEELFTLWGVRLPKQSLTEEEASYLAGMPEDIPPLEWVWSEMDRVWAGFGLDNTVPLAEQPIDEFYRHPVWVMNGVFSAADPESAGHRSSVARHIAKLNPREVADYGGGFGELALAIRQASPSTTVSIVEPYPTAVAQERLRKDPAIRFISALTEGSFDVLVAQDVLEHVEQPIDLAIELAESVRPGGSLILANHFAPAIQCHLPRTFHLSRTFPSVMRALGLDYQGTVDGADHAQIFTVGDSLAPRRARIAGRLSAVLAPVIEGAIRVLPRGRLKAIKTRLEGSEKAR